LGGKGWLRGKENKLEVHTEGNTSNAIEVASLHYIFLSQ